MPKPKKTGKAKSKPAKKKSHTLEPLKENGNGKGESESSPRFRHSLANSMNVDEDAKELARTEFLNMTEEKSPAEEHFLGEESEEPRQPKLVKMPEQPHKEPLVVDGRIAMKFLSFRVTRNDDRDLEASLVFSLELQKEHQGHLPRKIEDAWHDLEAQNFIGVEPPHLDNQIVQFYLDPNSAGQPDLETLVEYTSVYVERVAARGKGKNELITRLTLYFGTDFTDDVDEFCKRALDETVFAKLEAAQAELPLEQTEEKTT